MSKWKTVLLVMLSLFLLSVLISYLVEDDSKIDFGDKIVIIPIKGIITSEGSQMIPFSQSTIASHEIISYISQAEKEASIKGIILEIDSGGGTVIASKEIAEAVKNVNKPVVSWIREVGASGAYWIASASDIIVADSLSITGSIGVTSSYLEFSGLMEQYGVGYEELTAGEHKDMGTPFKRLTSEEKQLFQKKLDLIHDAFIEEIAINRHLNKEYVKKISTGLFFLGSEAKDLGLVDYLGGKDLAINITKELANVDSARIVKFEKKTSLIDVIGRLSAESFYFLGLGIGSKISEPDLKQELKILA